MNRVTENKHADQANRLTLSASIVEINDESLAEVVGGGGSLWGDNGADDGYLGSYGDPYSYVTSKTSAVNGVFGLLPMLVPLVPKGL